MALIVINILILNLINNPLIKFKAMKYLIHFILLSLIFTLVSCNNEKEVSQNPDEMPWYMGYLKGVIDNQLIFVENTTDDRYIPNGMYIQKPTGQKIYDWSFPINNYTLTIVLTPLETGDHKISRGSQDDINEWCCLTKIIDKKNDTKQTYYPSKVPFNIYIDHISFKKNSFFPYIKGTMEGVFYNIDNPQDSVVIKNMEFGIH